MRFAKETNEPLPPRLVLAHPQAGYADQLCQQLRHEGWEVHEAGDGVQARNLAWALDPSVVVLATELPTESGWLSCAKLVREHPDQAVVLVGAQPTAAEHRYATFVGATALVNRADGVPRLIDEILLAAAC